MDGAGVPADPTLCLQTAYRGDSAHAATVHLMTRTDRPTAIIGGNNVIALGALQAILDLGFRCPADVSVAGIDDVPWSGLVRPRITTVAQPIEEISRVAIEWLLERIAGEGAAVPARAQRVPASLHLRRFLPGHSRPREPRGGRCRGSSGIGQSGVR